MGKQAKQRIIALCLSIALLIGMVPMNAFAIDDLPGESDIPIVESNDIWDGSVASGFARGTGTESDPYIIETAEQLAYLSSSVNGDGKTLGSGNTYAGKFIKLANDIYLNDTTNWKNWDKSAPSNIWTAIGDGDTFAYNPFGGTFDGDGHTISGIYVVGDKYCGLFGYTDYDSTIKNVNVINSYLYSHEEISTEDGIYLCSFAGGVAVDNYGTIDNCTFSGTICGGGNVTLGGIAGISFGTIKNCVNNGTISGVDGGGSMGGIVGNSCEDAKDGGISYVINCTNNGTVSGNHIDKEGLYYIGGIAGSHEVYDEESTVRNCRNTGTIKVAQYDSRIGGIIGHLSYGMIECCCNSGKVLIEDGGNGSFAGGIVGAAFSYFEDEPLITVKNCYNTGDVTSDAGSTYACGVVGDNNADVINCYNSGTVYGYYIAAITEGDAGATTNCYYLAGKTSGLRELTTIGTSLTDVQMKKQASYNNWDFEKVWDIKEDESYPTLRCFAESESTAAIWDGSIATGFAKGTGTESDPYIIETAEQLAFLASSVNSGTNYSDEYIKLVNDIVLNDTANWGNWGTVAPTNTWTAIGKSSSKFFGGNFDGCGHTVSGIYIKNTNDYQGLFGYSNATIKDLSVQKSYIEADDDVGGIVGYNYGDGKIINCVNGGTIKGKCIGGVVGYNYSKIIYCQNNGRILSNGNNSSYGTDYICGGIVGVNRGEGTVNNCRNTGSVNGYVECSGGIVGQNYNIVSNCYNEGTVDAKAKQWASVYAGGLVGINESSGVISNCYNRGEILATRYSNYSSYAGAISGENNNGTVINCYSIGNISGTSKGIIGYNTGTSVTGCYYLDASIVGGNKTGTALTETQMKNKETYANWDFDNIWEIGFDSKYPYPTIQFFGSKSLYFNITFKDGENVISEDYLPRNKNIICQAPYAKDGYDFAYFEQDNSKKYYPGDEITVECDATYNSVWALKNTSENVWDGSIDTEWLGSGTEDDPFLISSAAELAGLAQNVNSGENGRSWEYFKLTSDIIINDNGEQLNNSIVGKNAWIPIGNLNNSFSGTFDGDGHTVSGIYINNNNDYQGLFGYIYDGTVKNLGVEKSYINGGKYVGGVVGYAYYSDITVCYNTGNISGSSYIGGIVGYAYNSNTDIIECYSTGNINGTSYIGGISGDSGTIVNSYNTGNISGTMYIGGINGYYGTVTNSYNVADISGTSSVGGISGGYGTLTNCYNIGSITGTSSSGGGISGSNTSYAINDCYYLDSCYSGTNYSGKATALTYEQMKDKSNYKNWSFNYDWEIGFDKNYPYPTLRSFGSKIHKYQQVFNNKNTVISNNLYSKGEKIVCTAPYESEIYDFAYYERDDGEKYYPGDEIIAEYDAYYTAFWYTKDSSENLWDGSIDTGWQGLGTESSPYLIGTAAELAGLAQQVNGGITYSGTFFKLTADIVINDGGEYFDEYVFGKNVWIPIGNNNYGFAGTFDGDGHTVCGIFIDSDSDDYKGLFGKVSSGVVKNLSVEKSYIKGRNYVGGIIGYFDGNSIITNCCNAGRVIGNYYFVGGIVGYAYYGDKISYCSNTGDISGDIYVGGIVGGVDKNGLIITNCYNIGNIEGFASQLYTMSTNVGIGGIIGTATSEINISNCYNKGSISGKSYGIGGIAGSLRGNVSGCYNTGTIIYDGNSENCAGGIVGYLYKQSGSSSDVSSCYNTGNIVSNGYYTGGVVGRSEAWIHQCYNKGNVLCNYSGSNTSRVGGIVGYSSAGLTDCYNTGTVTNNSTSKQTGGIVGYLGTASMSKCYNIGVVTGSPKALAGYAMYGSDKAWVFDNYYLSSLNISDSCGTALTEEQMKQKESFIGFDFESIWEIGVEDGYDYPTIKLYPDFEYILKDGKITIMKYKGTDKDVRIPDIINGYPVVVIAQGAFADNSDIESVFIPASVVAIDTTAFNNTSLVIICYEGSYADSFAAENAFETVKKIHVHNYTKDIINPTCTEGGYTVYACDGCGETHRGDETEPLGHYYVVDSYVAETADEPCHTVYKCDRDGCGDTYKKYEEKPKRTPTLNGKITTREIIDLEEMKKCGIDTNAPDNNIVFEFKAVYTYEGPSGGSSQHKSLTIYTNSKGKIVGYGGYSGYVRLYDNDSGYGYGGGGGGGSAGTSLSGSVWYYDPDTDTAIQPLGTNGDPNNPSYYYLRLNGYGGILKQMFEVTLEVQNSSDELWYEECKAEIILPDGLSLATMYDSGTNKAIQSINDDGVVEKNGSGSATWYVRGDKTGIFDIEAKVSGKIYPEPTDDFEMLFKTNEPIVIDDVKDCIQLDIYNVPQIIKNGQTAEIEVRLTNISNRVLNHVVLGIIGGEEMVVDQLEPGKSTSATKKVTFNLSLSSKEEIEYHLINSTFVCNLDLPFGGVHFAEIEDGEFDFDIAVYEESSFVNQVKDLTLSEGSFSWEKANKDSLNGIEKTNYDKLYLKLSVSLKGNQNANNVMAKLTAPEGFSFDPFEMVSEKTVVIDYIPANQTYVYPENIVLYPIYLAEPENCLFVSGKIMAEGFDTSAKPVLVFNVTENKEQGKIDLRNSFTTDGHKTWSYSLNMDISGFDHSSSQYDLELAKLSAALSAATYQIKTMESTFENLGFSNVKLCNYNTANDQISSNQDQVACAFATKKIIVDNKIYTVIAVAIRGTVGNEWYSNVEVGQGDIHEGFFNGYVYVSTQLARYYSELKNYTDISADNTKVLITGHSRGGAVADLLATEINDYGDLTTGLSVHSGGIYAIEENIYTYTFAAPNNTMLPIELGNIFNMVCETDIVPHMPGVYHRSGLDISVGNGFRIGYVYERDRMLDIFNRTFAFQDMMVTYDEAPSDLVILYDLLQEYDVSWVDRTIAELLVDDFFNTLEDLGDIETWLDPNEFRNFVMHTSVDLIAIRMAFDMSGDTTIGEMLINLLLRETDDKYATSGVVGLIYSNHCIESYISWLLASSELTYNNTLRYFELHCPVDVEVYNGDNELICRIVSNEVVYENGCHCVVDGDRKYFMVDGENYKLIINGYDEGVMNIDLFEFDAEGNVSRFVNYADVPVVKDKSSTFTIGNKPEDSTAEYSLSLYDDTDFGATKDVTGDNIENVNVKVNVTNRGFVSGNGTYIAGQSVVLTAEEFDSEFIGWYLGDQLLSTEKTYCFVCNADIELEARFENIPYPTVNGTIESFGDTDGEITVSLLAGGIVIDKVTVTDGTYSFEIPVNGTYTVEFAKENHATRQYEVTVDDADVTQNAKIHLIGDINGDGKVNITDVNKANAHASKTKFLNDYELVCADVTGEGNVNITDVNKINAHASKIKYLW